MSSSSSLQVGTTRTASLRVEPADLASSISRDPEDTFPKVFSTSRMVALMEIASSRILLQSLNPGQLSVGVNIDISHTAPTQLGALVTAEATFTGRDQKLYVFDVIARDVAGEVGRGTHKRAIVDVDRLEQSAQRRKSDDSQSL